MILVGLKNSFLFLVFEKYSGKNIKVYLNVILVLYFFIKKFILINDQIKS